MVHLTCLPIIQRNYQKQCFLFSFGKPEFHKPINKDKPMPSMFQRLFRILKLDALFKPRQAASASSLSPEEIAARYSLLCRATCPPDADNPAQRELSALQNLIEQQLPALARHYCPPGFADTWLGLKAELQRLREFCACPALAHKTLIAFGGGFSAGKSSLINALIGEKRLLPAQVDPTTSLPTYLMHGPAHAIHALNQYRRLIELSPEEFASLTHDEQARFGSSAARLLEATYLTHPSFAWQNLAFIDTPGYSKPDDANASRSDAQLARAWLNSAHAIVWAVSAEAGCISEDDLAFLATLNPDIPRIVVVTKADKKTEKDVADIAELIKKTMAERNLPARAVWAVSSRYRNKFNIGDLLKWLELLNKIERQSVRIGQNIFDLLATYGVSLENETNRALELVNMQNRTAATLNSSEISSALLRSAERQENNIRRKKEAGRIFESLSNALQNSFGAIGSLLGISAGSLLLEKAAIASQETSSDIPLEIFSQISNLAQKMEQMNIDLSKKQEELSEKLKETNRMLEEIKSRSSYDDNDNNDGYNNSHSYYDDDDDDDDDDEISFSDIWESFKNIFR